MNKKCEGIDCVWCANPECPNDKEMANKQIEQALNELVKQGYMRKLKGDNYKLTNKGKGYAECLIKINEVKDGTIQTKI